MTDDIVFQEMLARIERKHQLPIDAFTSKNSLADHLADLFGEGNTTLLPTSNRIEGLFRVADITKVSFPEVGINKVTFTAFGKQQTRFTIPFRQGLFGFAKALELFKALV